MCETCVLFVKLLLRAPLLGCIHLILFFLRDQSQVFLPVEEHTTLRAAVQANGGISILPQLYIQTAKPDPGLASSLQQIFNLGSIPLLYSFPQIWHLDLLLTFQVTEVNTGFNFNLLPAYIWAAETPNTLCCLPDCDYNHAK